MVLSVVLVLVIVFMIGLGVVAQKNNPREEQMVMKLIYTFLIGIFMAVFVGVGVAAFYPEPKYPQPPLAMKFSSPDAYQTDDSTDSAKWRAEMEEFDKQEKKYQTESQEYCRNVSIVVIAIAIAIVVVSLTVFQKILIIADGLLLGGLLTLIYGVMRGFGAEDNMFRFVVVSIGLFISLFLGYWKFSQPVKK